MNSDDPALLSKTQRVEEIPKILALGILRRHQIQLDGDPQVEAL
ncbi:MAG: hypothetical protein V3W41_18315 [Planctomycetota bacterium]